MPCPEWGKISITPSVSWGLRPPNTLYGPDGATHRRVSFAPLGLVSSLRGRYPQLTLGVIEIASLQDAFCIHTVHYLRQNRLLRANPVIALRCYAGGTDSIPAFVARLSFHIQQPPQLFDFL